MSETFSILWPQVVLAAAGSLFVLAGTFAIPRRLFAPAALVVLALVSLLLWSGAPAAIATQSGLLAVQTSTLAVGFQLACLALAALVVLQTMALPHEHDAPLGEFHGLLMLLLSGLLTTIVANDLIVLFLSLELISIPTYVLLYLGRRDARSQESTIKYFLLSIFSAASLLYGLALVYGLTGTTQLGAIRSVLSATYDTTIPGQLPALPSAWGVVALVLIFGGLGFKLAAVPFHFYAPDVYEGTSAFNAGVLAVVPKAAGVAAFLRLAGTVTVGFESTAQQLAVILAIVSMTGGNCLAMLQTNIRRMLAYSGTAHAGYLLVGLAVTFWQQGHLAPAERGLPDGMQATLLYLLVYSLASIGFFSALIHLGRPHREVEHIDDLTGLARSRPLIACLMALFLFSMAGIPPLPGFWGKFALFSSALSVRQPSVETGFQLHPAFAILAVVGMLNAAIGAVYYLRLIGLMFLQDPQGAPAPEGRHPARLAAVMVASLMVVVGFFPGPLFKAVQRLHPAPASAQVAPAAGATTSQLADRPAR